MGRADTIPDYEEGGIDYPYDYVRWTEQRNMESVLALMSSGGIDTDVLTTHRFQFDKALDAYKLISENTEPHIGVVLEYEVDRLQPETVFIGEGAAKQEPLESLVIGFAGAGNYAISHLLPHLKDRKGVSLHGLVTATGLNAEQKGRKFGFRYCATDFDQLVRDEDVNAVFIATRHATHARFACDALRAGKHVFVEKPVAVTPDQLTAVVDAFDSANGTRPTGLMVGLNRRFAPMVTAIKRKLSGRGPMQINYRVNSGHISKTSWLHGADEGGGMMVGEMCHFVDVMRFLVDAKPIRVFASCLRLRDSDVEDTDNTVVVVTFEDGSVGSLAYSTVGSKVAPKERIEVFVDGDMAVLDDFRSLTTYVGGKRRRVRSANQDKGQRAMVAATVDGFSHHGMGPIPISELEEVMRVIFAARESVGSAAAVNLVSSDA